MTRSQTPLDKMKRFEERIRCQDSLAEFVKAAWSSMDPAKLAWSWHHDAICDHIEAVYKGKISKLAVALPPRHTKSTIISVAAPAWGWTWNPGFRYLCASYVIGLALRDAQYCHALVDSPWYQDHFGDIFKWHDEQNAKARYETDKHGFRIATSVGGSGTGEGGHIVSIDDPHNISEVESDARRLEVLDWYDGTMASRLNDQQTSGTIIIGHRLHDQDLIGHVLGQGGWEYLMLPAEYDPPRKCVTSLGWEDPRTIEGEPLWEQKFPAMVLDRLKVILQINYFAQYQQQPVTAAGTIIKAESLLKYVDEGQTYLLHTPAGEKRVLKMLCRAVVSTDFATTTGKQNDETAYLTWDICPDGEALLKGILVGKWEAPEAEANLTQLLKSLSNLWCVMMEDVGYQKNAIQRFKAAGFPVRPFHPIQDKVARCQNIAVYFVMGYFYFDPNIHGYADYQRQLLGFPRMGHDDMVDATSIMADLYSKGEPQLTAIEAGTAREFAMIKEIEESNPDLAAFLLEEFGG